MTAPDAKERPIRFGDFVSIATPRGPLRGWVENIDDFDGPTREIVCTMFVLGLGLVTIGFRTPANSVEVVR